MEAETYVVMNLRDYIESNFESLLTKKELSDVIFEVGNEFNKKQFHCIKCLFAIHSPIFYELLYGSKIKEKGRDCIIEILDITPDAFEYLRALFYGLSPQINISNIIQVFHASNIYCIEALKQYCLHFLYEIIPTIYEMNSFIKLLNELIDNRYNYMISDIVNNLNLTERHFDEMIKMDDNYKTFSNSPFELIETLLFLSNNNNLFGDIKQEKKWNAVMKWSLYQTKKHKNKNGINYYLKQFVKYFNFQLFDTQFFHSNVAKLNILDNKTAFEMLNFHCNGLLNVIQDRYDNLIIHIPIISESSIYSIIKIQHYSGGYLCVDQYNDDEVKISFIHNNNNNNNPIFDDYYQWIAIQDKNGFWSFQNVATSKFLSVATKVKDNKGHILKCNETDGKSLFCIFMIHITPWKHCKIEPIWVHPNYFISIKDKNIELSTKNGLYEEFKIIPIGNDDNKIDKIEKNEENVLFSPKSFDSFNFSLDEMQENETKTNDKNDNNEEMKQQQDDNKNDDDDDDKYDIIDSEILSKWKGDKELTIEDKFGSYFLAIKGSHSFHCVANKIMDDLSEWIIQYHIDKEDVVRFKNKKSGKYLRIANHGFTVDCAGNEDDKLSEFEISHSEHDWHLCRLKSMVYDGYCVGLSENGIKVTHHVARDSLIYLRFE